MAITERATGDFGMKMKRAREERGISLRQIAASTKIGIGALEALERNDISKLPGGIFSRAFVRSYAIEIGLDPEQTVRDFIAQFPHDSVTAGSPHVPQEDHAAIESDRRSAETAFKLVAISLPIAAAILYFTLANRSRSSNTRAEPDKSAAESPSVVAPPPPALDRSPGAAPVASTLAAPAPAPAARVETPSAAASTALPAGVEPLTFEIVASDAVTLDVTVDGTRRESRAVTPGERLVFQADREMVLRMSSAGAVELTINNQPAVSLGAIGEERTVQIGRRNYGSFLASQ